MGVERTLRPMPAGRGQNGDDAEGGGDDPVRSGMSCRARAAAANGIKLMVTGYTKEATMLGISMAMLYWPFRAAADSSDSSRAFCSWPMTILVSMMFRMLIAELLRVMGMPMARICRIRWLLPEGTSRDCVDSGASPNIPPKTAWRPPCPP